MNDKQRLFAHEYIKDCNASEAAIRAGYSAKTSAVKGCQLYSNQEIFNYIKGLQVNLEKATGVTAAMVIAELAKIGFHNVQDFVNGGNSVLELKGLPAEKSAAVSGVKTTINENTGNITTELKFHDKVSALEKLGRHLGIFEKDNDQRRIDLPAAFKVEIVESKEED